MATETVENYLKALYTLTRESPTGEAGMKSLATLVGVTTGTATTMVKRLAAAKLARYERFGGVRLTSKGEAAAVDILRRHRLIETFLVQTLKLDWSVVHNEAERLEHAISPTVLEALDRHLGHPSHDPHGDPIPSAEGHLHEPGGRPLTDFTPGTRVRVVRIADQDSTFLTFVAGSGLRPGSLIEVRTLDSAAQTMSVQPKGRDSIALALTAATKIWCDAAEQARRPTMR
ncbi:MAG: metal-dependent transcriptional regulator [Phycisphaerales bacterium]|nr:metal-dependent transcriptional regulator [Phycisphaerales bacterium]